MHPNSYEQCRQFVAGLKIHTTGPLRIADVGAFDCNGTYRALFDGPGWEYLGYDLRPGGNVDVVHEFGTGAEPPGAVSFDIVISGQCAEHVAAPWRWIVDVARLLKPRGLLWLAIPNTEVFHEHPIDAWRCWPAGMRALFEEAGLSCLACYASDKDTIGVARAP